MKNFAEINRASTGAKKTNQLFERLWEHSRTLRRVGLVLVMCLIAIPQAWAVKTYMDGGETLFIIADGDGAWGSSACVKASYSTNSSDASEVTTTADSRISTTWLWDGSWGGASSKKCFFTIVPNRNDLKGVRLCRYASNCSTWWNWNGGWAAQSARSQNYYNVLYSSGTGESNFGWKNAEYYLNLFGETNSWASAIGKLQDCGNGVFKYSFVHTATASSYEFKIQDSQSQWHGSNVTLSGLSSGTTYIITATVDLKSGIGSLVMSCSVHSPGDYEDTYGQTLTYTADNREYEVYSFSSISSSENMICAGATTTVPTSANCLLKFATTTAMGRSWIVNYVNGRGSSYSNLSAAGTEFNGMGSTGAYQMNFRSNSKLTMIVSGYDQFSMYAQDASASNKFKVYIDGSDVTTGTSTTAGVRRYNISTGQHRIEITAVNTSDNKLWGFSLRIPCAAPTALTAGSLTTSGATLTVTDAANTNDYEFYVSTSSTAPLASATPTYTVSGGKSKVISDLSAGTTYYAWARSKCKTHSKSDWVALTGSTFTTTSAGCTSVSAPTGLSCTAQTKNSLTFSWTAASNASSYDVYLYSDAGCTSAVTPTEGKPYNVTGTSATLSGLTAGTTYYCKVQSKGDGSTYCESGGITSAASGTTKTVHSISFNVNGGSGSLATISGIEYGSSQTLTAIGSSITRTGWTFTGWNTSAYGDGTAYADQATVASVTANMTLYAQWEKVMYMKSSQSWWYDDDAWFAVWVANADESKQAWVKMTKAENCSDPAVYTATVPGNGYTKIAFVRKNPASDVLPTWDNKWNHTSKEALPTSNNQCTITGGTGDECTTSWGTYSAPTYTISYAKGTPPTGSASIGGSKSNQTKNCGVDFTLPNVVFTLAGYTQDGWATSNGGSKAYNLGGSYTTESAQTFYPHWSANQYSVSHSLSNVTKTSGATGSSAATCGTNYTAEFAASSGYTLPTSITVTIGGNSTTAGTEYTWTQGTGTVVVNGAYITGNVVISVSGVIKKTVTYKKNGGASGADGSVTGSTTDASSPYAHGSTVTTLANGFTNTGYKFKWWNTAYDGSGEDFYVGEKFDITANTNLYAQWESVGSDEEFWVGDNFTFSSHVMSVGDMRLKENNVDSNTDITKDYNQVSKYSSTAKKAKVLAMDAANEYLEVYFSDGSAINELHLGTVHNDESGTKKVVVIYSTTADFTSGVSEQIEVSIPTCNQSSKSVTDFSPSTEDLYKYARIYKSVSSAVYSYTGPASGGASKMRIYSIKAKKGAACESLDAPEGLSCTAQTKNSLTFGWSAVTNASSYDVYLYSDEDCTAEVTPTEGKPYNVTGTSATLTGLDGGTTYYCKVRTKGNGTTYCTNGAITTTAASGKTKYGVTYSKGGATSGTAPTDDNSYAVDAEVTVKDTTGCKFVYASHTFRGWTDGTTFYKVGQTFNMPDDNVTLTAVWDSKSGGSGSTYRIPVKSSYDDQGGSATPRYLWVTDAIGWLTWDAGASTISSSSASYSDFSYQTGSGKNTILIYSEIASVKKIRLYCYGSNAFSCNGISTGTTYSSYSALTESTDYTFNGNSISNGANGVIEIIFSTALAANTYVQFTFSKNGKFYGVELETTSGGSGSWTNKYVAFDTNAGVVGTPSLPDTIKGVPSGKKIVQPADPTATGYIFDNWYPTVACNTAAFDWSGTITKDTTLYAKFNTPTTLIQQPAKIAGKRVAIDTLDAKNHPEDSTVIVHQLISPTPYGTCNITYKLCYENHVQLDKQPTIKYGTGAGVGHDTIKMPMEEIHMYELVAYLRTGGTRGAGDLVTTDTAVISVEKTWPIKVRYVMDGVELREPTEWSAYPSVRTSMVRVMKEQQGFILDSLEYGVGITVDSVNANWLEWTYATYIKASNASTITAHYKVQDTTVYFFNTFEKYWYSTIMKKYEYGGSYWDGAAGSGAYGLTSDTVKRVSYDDAREGEYKSHLTANKTVVSFTSRKMDGSSNFWGKAGTENPVPYVIYRDDYNDALKMFVPVTTNVDEDYIAMNKSDGGEAHYYRGFWVRYSPDRDSTGYFLRVYNQVAAAGATEIQSLPLRLTQTGEGNTWELTATMDLEAGKTYGFKITKANTSETVWLSYNGTLTSADHTGKVLDATSNNIGLTTTSAGDYTFHVFCKAVTPANTSAITAAEVQGALAVTVDYATTNGDFRVVYQDDDQLDLTDGVGVEAIASQTIRARANGQDTVTFFVRKDAENRVMKFQKFTDGAWADVAVSGTIGLTNTVDQTFTVSKDTTYQIYLQQNEDGTTISATGMDYYSGKYYLRTDCVDAHKWDYKQSMEAHQMVETDYSSHLATDPFTHYFVHWVAASKNVKFVVATKYSPTLTDTLITDNYANVAGGNLPSAGASVRFMYNKGTNAIKRAYLAGAQGGALNPNFLKLTESSSSKMKNMSGSAITSITFGDLGNFTYQAEIQAQPGLTGKLTAEYNSQTQYFKGSAGSSETILGGTGLSWQHIVMTYDFKTNRLICAWTPGDTIDETLAINADIMIIRRGQHDAEQIVFKTNETKLTNVKYVYGVIQLDYNDLVGMMPRWDYWAYEHCMYYISFPFDVLVSDITGVGSIGKEWRIQRYNGAKRAEKGWFEGDGVTTFWEDVQAGDTLHAYEGYSLLLNRTRFNSASSAIWENKSRGSSVYLFFPSLSATIGIVADSTVTVHVPSHLCTIDRPFLNQNGAMVNHKNTDSHWNMMGTPLFENKTAFSIADNYLDPENPTYGTNIKYIYAWNSAGNTLGIQLTLDNTWKFKTMYSYMVQYAGDVVFKGSTVTNSVAARRKSAPENYHVNLELTKDDAFVGRTYVELRENAVDSFMLNEDIYMVKNGVNADLYTLAGGYEVGANVLPIENQVVPVGIDVQTAGTYVFSMPSNFSGTVTLVDTYHQTRTNLAIDDYEIALPKGNISDRFYLEININNIPTAIDGVEGGSFKDGKAHKFIMNDMMYILKDGVLYDAQGKRVK